MKTENNLNVKSLKIGLYSSGKYHSIDKYFQVLSLIDLMITDERFVPCILTDGTSIADKDLYSRYGEVLEFIDLNTQNINELNLSAIIVIDPYSNLIIPYRDIEVPIIYKEYGVAGVEAGTGYLVNRSAYRYSDLIITESEFTRSTILEKYPNKTVCIGSPAFDYIFKDYDNDPRFEKDKINVLWTPHHSVLSKKSFDLIEGGVYSTFVSFKDYLTGQFLEDNPDVILHIKYHPILSTRYNAYCRSNKINDNFNKFLNSIKNNPRIFIHDKEDYHGLFMHSDIILNDSMSFTLEWISTGKPMIVLESSQTSKRSPFGEELIDTCYYRSDSIISLKSNFNSIIREGIDFKKEERKKVSDKYFINPGKPNSESLLNIIYDRYISKD